MNNYYDRYKDLRLDGKILHFPPIKIDRESTDLFVVFDKNTMRLDNLSYRYYGDPNYAWLLMLANPQYGSLEFDIPDKVTFRIPYPLQTALNRYESKMKKYLGN
jgi:hypothetical protein